MDDASVGFDDGDSVRVLYAGDSLRDHNHGGILQGLVECRAETGLRCKVERGGRIVEDEYLGLTDKCARDRKPLLLTARKRRALLCYEGVVAIGKFRDEGIRLRDRCRRADLLCGRIVLAPLDIVCDSIREELALLHNVADLLTECGKRIIGNFASVDIDLARCGIVISRDQRDQRGFARSRCSDDSKSLAVLYL